MVLCSIVWYHFESCSSSAEGFFLQRIVLLVYRCCNKHIFGLLWDGKIDVKHFTLHYAPFTTSNRLRGKIVRVKVISILFET